MNSIRQIININQKELEQNVSDLGSWHYEYRDTSYIYIGQIPYELKEEDIIVIFSQFGVPTHIKLIKDKETGKSKGFCYMKYEDSRLCVLAIDNLNGVKVFDKILKVDHVYFKVKENELEDDLLIDYGVAANAEIEGEEKKLLEYKETTETAEDTKESKKDEFKDPMDEFEKFEKIDEFKDPMDEFKDPMDEYINKDDRKRQKHRHSKHKKRKEV
ncbi:hypothetical protein HYPBUDRAFT_107680 [Hyphopichia burtonii NRRL Y-1933]|uniref:RRM domain-containing protein n=1 Tax=Hyphopichia burtonii NRRL Y-1933 TaxID=984485 RepID=A0A1E4RL08_9ASCO|nr:hypothetical protein HYPBUDRAFT_107680 [Hyphopichia burtonii NRRL Y-1933]ODV67881.1 hypothetical protein HYPBUDRAFT_107680 [Hyphopichia burtonii NRRL Y-1933]